MSFFINKIFYCRDFKFFTAALNWAFTLAERTRVWLLTYI